MTYPASFHRLVIIGTQYTNETFNITCSIVPTGAGAAPAVTQDLADDVRDVVAAWWPKTEATGGWELSPQSKLTSVKLNRIGTDGKYVDATAIESVLTTPVAGGSSALQPAQLAIAGTLRGENERARAGRGRMFFPQPMAAAFIQSDGRFTAAKATALATNLRSLLQNIDGVYIDGSIPLRVGIASKSGSGGFQVVRQISVGRTVDVIRSRRSSLPEDPQYVTY